jgi:hypothetical protein
MKYVVVTGGIISGLGKGITASSIGVLLKGCGWRVSAIKIDPYLNVDAGTMSPYEHGECYVLDDGGEVDLDLGNYERYLDVSLSRDNNITTGKIFKSVIDKERRGEFNGKTVSVVPHVTNAIQEWIERVSRTPIDNLSDPPDVCVIELGGTIGDIESMPYVEALRQMRYNVGPDNFFLAHVSLVPIVGEAKTKPTQHGVKEIRSVRHTVSAFHSRVDLRSCAVAAPVRASVVHASLRAVHLFESGLSHTAGPAARPRCVPLHKTARRRPSREARDVLPGTVPHAPFYLALARRSAHALAATHVRIACNGHFWFHFRHGRRVGEVGDFGSRRESHVNVLDD